MPVSVKTVMTQPAYLLFYQRRKTHHVNHVSPVVETMTFTISNTPPSTQTNNTGDAARHDMHCSTSPHEVYSRRLTWAEIASRPTALMTRSTAVTTRAKVHVSHTHTHWLRHSVNKYGDCSPLIIHLHRSQSSIRELSRLSLTPSH